MKIFAKQEIYGLTSSVFKEKEKKSFLLKQTPNYFRLSIYFQSERCAQLSYVNKGRGFYDNFKTEIKCNKYDSEQNIKEFRADRCFVI